MKTLIIKYLPSGEGSNTKKILDIFLSKIEKSSIEIVDLLKTEVPIFNEQSINAYYKRNYHGKTLDAEEVRLLEKNDSLIKQLKSASIIVLACPMHNFGFPALMKAYIDATTFHNETFAYDKKMMSGKKILTLFSSGGEYPNDIFNLNYPNWNSIALTAHATFNFMGFDEVKTVGTSLRNENNASQNLTIISNEIDNVVNNWYK
jgi:FMN-dependent NADH-azoreductase